MKNYLPESESDSSHQQWNKIDLYDRYSQSQNILIPIDLDTRDRISGYYVLDNQELPAYGQKYLNEIIGTPFTAELANTLFCLEK